MAPKNAVDQFANYAVMSVTESAANTLTFKKLETGVSLTEKVAWVIARIEYIVAHPLANQFDGNADTLHYGLSLSSAFTVPGMSEDTIIDFNLMLRTDFGAAAVAKFDHWPRIKDFTGLPGGGIVVPPTPLYLFAKGTSLAAAETVTARIHYTLLPLAVDQYWELVESRRVISS